MRTTIPRWFTHARRSIRSRRGEMWRSWCDQADTVAVAGSTQDDDDLDDRHMPGTRDGPTVVVGGVVGAMGSNARLGKSDLMLVEADESDRSFLMLTPTFAVVTNIDASTWTTTRTWPKCRSVSHNSSTKCPFYVRRFVSRRPARAGRDPGSDAPPRDYGLSAQADVRRTKSVTTRTSARASRCGAARKQSAK